MIGSNLTEKTKGKLCNILQRSLDIFAWTPTDMTGIPRHIAEHRLNVRKGCQPVRQKKMGQAAERNIAINDEVSKLVATGIMKEVHYHDWLSNPVMVKKSDNSWRMCVDFKDLNKACPKDGYPLPEIDWKVESLCGFPFKCFLDAYKGYHQIQMAEEDEEQTVFITNRGIFCYTKMPFGLRNAGATYQRLVDKAFYRQIGRNLEVYVDDLVIKIRTEDEIVRDIEETFKTLRKINMKLNPKKCTFRVEEGMFLGYQVNTKGIKICLDKVDAVLSLQSPKCLKYMQRLNGKLASLNRFLAKSAEKSLPFFKTLKKCIKKSDFLWTGEAEAAFRKMKEHIAKLPMLTAPEEQEELTVYLASSKEAVSVVLMMEREARPRVSVKGQVLADFIVQRPEKEVCERQDKWKCVLTRLIDDLLALDSKVRFDISDRRLELTATFSIPTYSEYTKSANRLSNNDLKGVEPRIGIQTRVCNTLCQDLRPFNKHDVPKQGSLQKQLFNEFQEIGSMASFKVLETQFQMFIKSKIYLNDEYIVMTRNYFLQYTQLDIPEFRETLVQFMEYVKKSIDERALHKREHDSRVNERQTQTIMEKVDTSKELDASSVIIESNRTESKKQDTSSKSGNDADIRPIYDEEPMAEVQMTADDNVSATGQQHTEQPESNNEGEVDQNANQCYDTCPL
ncbi:reverse transcriptase domain-containing protein [Tanacetum coccineum]